MRARLPSFLDPIADAAALLNTGALRPLSPRTTLTVLRRVAREGIRPDLVYTINALQDPHRIALAHDRGVLTWARLYERILRLANWAAGAGVRPRDAVAIVLPNRPEFVEAQAASLRIGATASFLNPRAPHDVIAGILDRLDPALVITDSPGIAGGRRVLDVGDDYEKALASSSTTEPVASRRATGRVVIFTSGTTGRPKGAVRGLSGISSSAALGFLRVLPFRRDDVHMAVAPLYHATGSGFLTIAQALSSPCVLVDKFSPEAFCEAVRRWRVTTTAVVPTMLHELCTWPRARDYDLSSLRIVVCTGSPLRAAVRDAARDLLGEVVYDLYGATEMAWVSVATPDDMRRRPGTVGRPVPGVAVEIRDEDGRVLPRGRTGEVWARNPLAMEAYLDDPQLTAERVRDGFVSVRDVGHLDGNGYLFIADRADDMIITGGVNVYPAEVERALLSHRDVREAGVVGVPDEKWGQRVVAAVVASGVVAPESLIRFCKDRLPPAAVPKEIRLVDALPRTQTGKVLRRDISGLWTNATKS